MVDNLKPMQTEVEDTLSFEQFEGTLTGVSPTSITPASGKVVRYFMLQMPDIGPNQNPINRYIRYSVNGGVKFSTMKRGEAIALEGYLPSNTLILKGDGGAGTLYYELVFGLDTEET